MMGTITIHVSLCAVLGHGGRDRESHLDLPAGATVGDVLARLEIPAASDRIACVNGRPASPEVRLAAGDRVYVFSPVSGG